MKKECKKPIVYYDPTSIHLLVYTKKKKSGVVLIRLLSVFISNYRDFLLFL